MFFSNCCVNSLVFIVLGFCSLSCQVYLNLTLKNPKHLKIKKIGYKLNGEPENDDTKLMTSVQKEHNYKDMRKIQMYLYDIEELIRDDMLKEERNEILSNLRKRNN